MKKQILAAIAMILVVVAAIVWVRAKRTGTDDQPSSTDTTAVVADHRPSAEEHPGEIPSDLEQWIEATLWRNGLLASHRDSFLTSEAFGRTRLWVDSSGHKPLWTVDLSGLDVAVLGHDTAFADPVMSDPYNANLLVSRTRLCREADRRLKYPGWVLSGADSLRCGPDDGRKLVRAWFRERFGRDPGGSEFSMEQGKVSMDISCRGNDAVEAVGRLRSVEFSRLRLVGCSLSASDALVLSGVEVERLELIDLKTDHLPFSGARVSRRLSIQGGSVRWLDLPMVCPQEGVACEYGQRVLPPGLSVEARDVPLCGRLATGHLERLGVKLENARCQDIPLDMIARSDSLDEAWKALVGDDLKKILLEPHDTISLEERPTVPGLKQTWELAVGTGFSDECGAGSYPKEYYLERQFGSKGRIFDRYFEGPAIQVSYKGKKILAGMTREALLSLMGRPAVDRGGFLAWTVTGTCSGELANLRAHFDAEGKLDAWMDLVDPECGGC